MLLVEKLFATLVWLGLAVHLTGLLPDLIAYLEQTSISTGRNRTSLLVVLQAIASIGATLILALWLGAVLEALALTVPKVANQLIFGCVMALGPGLAVEHAAVLAHDYLGRATVDCVAILSVKVGQLGLDFVRNLLRRLAFVLVGKAPVDMRVNNHGVDGSTTHVVLALHVCDSSVQVPAVGDAAAEHLDHRQGRRH